MGDVSRVVSTKPFGPIVTNDMVVVQYSDDWEPVAGQQWNPNPPPGQALVKSRDDGQCPEYAPCDLETCGGGNGTICSGNDTASDLGPNVKAPPDRQTEPAPNKWADPINYGGQVVAFIRGGKYRVSFEPHRTIQSGLRYIHSDRLVQRLT